jgi:hypothetical protein
MATQSQILSSVRASSRIALKREATSSGTDTGSGITAVSSPAKQVRTTLNSDPSDQPVRTSGCGETSKVTNKSVESTSSDMVTVATTSENDKKMGSVLQMLECPVCLDYPRAPPIYSCRNGHIVCGPCHSNISTSARSSCPTCRDHVLEKCAFVERLADRVTKDVLVPCKHGVHGCPKHDKLGGIWQHEERCQYREVHCPAKHRGACPWVGSLSKMIMHVREQACIQVNYLKNLLHLSCKFLFF